MHSRTLASAVAMAALLFTSAAALANTSVSEQGQASVVLHKALTLTAERELAFGRVIIPASGSQTVTVSPADVPAIGGTALSSGLQTSARFQVLGSNSAQVSIDLPSTPVLLQGPGAATLELTNLLDSANGQLALNAAGEGTFFVGGTLTVPSTASQGQYVGDFDVLVDYQ